MRRQHQQVTELEGVHVALVLHVDAPGDGALADDEPRADQLLIERPAQERAGSLLLDQDTSPDLVVGELRVSGVNDRRRVVGRLEVARDHVAVEDTHGGGQRVQR
ncbi:hypothetical protein C5L38_09290 [Streptomyces sp. WAC00288]|nr:hypothetical protein C5L38_09290 [Streptomyces sp. WAC00288]